MTSTSNGRKIHPQSITETSSQHSSDFQKLPLGNKKKNILRTEPSELFSSHQEEEENATEQLLKLEKRMKLGRVQSCMRSLKCLVLLGVIGLILFSLMISAVWFTVFLTTMISFGDAVRESTFHQLHSEVLSEMSRMKTAALSVSSMGNGFGEISTSSQQIRDAVMSTQLSLLQEFGQVGISFYPFNQRGAFIFSNLYDPSTPEVVHGFTEYKQTPELKTQQFISKNLSSGVLSMSPEFPTNFTFYTYPQNFVDHVKSFNQSNPILFSRPLPSFCFQNPNVPGWEDGICMLTLIKVWSHSVDPVKGVHATAQVLSTTQAFSQKLTRITRPDAMSFLITTDGALISVSKGLDRIKEDEKKWRLYQFNKNDPSKSTLRQATEYPDPMVSKSAEALHEKYGSKTIAGLEHESGALSVNGYYVDYEYVVLSTLDVDQNYPGQGFFFLPEVYFSKMILVHVIPTDAFTGTSIVTGLIVIAAALVGSIASLVAVVIMSCFINRPVKKLIRQMESVKDMDLTRVSVSKFTYFSELRQIQSMFYFLVLNLKQYQSFLPSHVLQMIEARKVAHSSKNSKKKRVRHATVSRTMKLTTVEDELRSQSSVEGSESQSKSFFGSVHSASQLSKSNRLSHQFTLGMFRRNLTVVQVQIINIQTMLHRVALQDFVIQHSQLTDLISKLVNLTHSATLSTFSQDSFFISLNATISSSDHAKRAARMAVHMQRRIQMLNDRLSQQAMEPFQIVISISTGEGFVSTLGTSSQKQQVIFDAPVDVSEMQLRATEHLLRADILKSLNNVSIILDQNTIDKLPKKHIQSRIFDVIATRSTSQWRSEGEQKWSFHYLFELQDIALESKKEEEWMYLHDQKEKEEKLTERNDKMTKAWTLIVADESREACRILTELMSPSGASASHTPSFKEDIIETQSQRIPSSSLYRRLMLLAESLTTEHDGDLSQYCKARVSHSAQFGKTFMWASLVGTVRDNDLDF
mmetsp:Transcript_10264/g.38109  ORF Transcript_10264/g.38109 Transcript_10264/m.38109 type:complete len:977 (-) Transcript_10264:2926-5856(-)